MVHQDYNLYFTHKEKLLSRSPTRIVAVLIVTTILCAGCGEKEGVSAVRTPELRAVPAIAKPARTPEPSESANSGGGDIPDLRIGNFDRPDEDTVPEYEILEREPADRDGAHAVRLLVDSRARTQADYEVIARDLKARYADYDAVSVEFTDTRDVLDYRGAALIFNTPAGVYYMGYIYGPPKTKGYYVRAAE